MSVGLDDICNNADGTITNKHEKDFHHHHQILYFTQVFGSKSERMTLVERKDNCLMMICGLGRYNDRKKRKKRGSIGKDGEKKGEHWKRWRKKGKG